MRLTCTAALVLAAFSIGCGATTSSKNIRTAGVVALIDVTADRADNRVVSTELVIGGASSNTSLILDGGDTLYAEVNGEKKQLLPVGGEKYEATFNQGEEFVVRFERTGDDSAPNSKGTLPEAFEITSAFGNAPISRKDGTVKITWSPAGSSADVRVDLEGDCILSETYKVGGDPGSYTVAPGTLRAWTSKKDQACNVTVRVTRTVAGQLDPALDRDSRFLLHQVRTARFVSGP